MLPKGRGITEVLTETDPAETDREPETKSGNEEDSSRRRRRRKKRRRRDDRLKETVSSRFPCAQDIRVASCALDQGSASGNP